MEGLLKGFRIYLLPGLVLQSVIVAGGYGTGREVVEYFTRHGIQTAWTGFFVAFLSFALVFCLCLELSRRFNVYDYRRFFHLLLGRAWFLFEILLITMFMLVLAVIGSAAGEIAHDEWGLPSSVGAGLMLGLVVVLMFFGRQVITIIMAYWSFYLFAVLAVYLIVAAMSLDLKPTLALPPTSETVDAIKSALQYTFYNSPAIPVILYCAHAIETRRQAILSGLIGTTIVLLPGLGLHLSFSGAYPEILEAPLPIYAMFDLLQQEALKFAYLIMLMGTFIESGAGNLQGFIERVNSTLADRDRPPLKPWSQALIAALAMGLALLLAQIGMTKLIAEGYGALAWAYFAVFIVPLFSVGLYRLTRSSVADDSAD